MSSAPSDGLTVLGTGQAVWDLRDNASTVAVPYGSVHIMGLTILNAALDVAVSPSSFLVPRVLSLGPGVTLSMENVSMTTSCDTLLLHQQFACGLMPWAAFQIRAGLLVVAGWRDDNISLRNVAVKCGDAANITTLGPFPTPSIGASPFPPSPAAPPAPVPAPPCIALTAGSAHQLAAALGYLAEADATNSTQEQRPPAYITLTANISLADGWPVREQPVPINRNLTLAGAPPQPGLMRKDTYAQYAGALNGSGSGPIVQPPPGDLYGSRCSPSDVGLVLALPPVAAGWSWPPLVALDLDWRARVLNVTRDGSLTITGLVLENLVVGAPGFPVPYSLVAGQVYAVHVERPSRITMVDMALSFTQDEYNYWLYWVTLASSPASDVAAQANWMEKVFPNIQGKQATTADALRWPCADSERASHRRVTALARSVVFPQTVTRNGLGFVLPDKRVPLTDLVGASSCRELASALNCSGPEWRPVVVLAADISLAPGPGGCGPGDWPEGGVAVTRDTAIVGDVGRQLSVLDWGRRLAAISVPGAVILTIKGTVLVNNSMAAATEEEAAHVPQGRMTHLLYAIGQTRPQANVALFNCTLEVPAAEVALAAALAGQQAAPPNTLEPAELAQLKALLRASRVAAGGGGGTGADNSAAASLPDGCAAVALSSLYASGITGTNVLLTSNVTASLGPGLGRGAPSPFNSSPVVVSYLGGPLATPDGLAAPQKTSSASKRLPGWAIAVMAVLVPAAVITLAGLAFVGFRRRQWLTQGPGRGRAVMRLLSLDAKQLLPSGSPASGAPPDWDSRSGLGWAAGGVATRPQDLAAARLPLRRSASFPCSFSTPPLAEAAQGAGADSAQLPAFPSNNTRCSGHSGQSGTTGRTGGGAGGTGTPSSVRSGPVDNSRMPPRLPSVGEDPGARSTGGSSISRDSFDRPPSELEAHGSTGELPAAEELAAMVKTLKDEMSAGCEELVISEVLGAGAYGVVYRGVWKGLSVAVKTLRFTDRMYGNERARRAALREAAICCSLHHPNVVSTYTYDLKPVRTVVLDEPPGAGGTNSGAAAEAATTAAAGGGGGGEHASINGSGGTGGGLRIVEPEVREWKLFLIQEYCAGGTLLQLVDRGAFMWGNTDMPLMQRVVATAIEIASGMSHIHSKNVVHGDLNPNNVLLAHTTAPAKQPLVAKIADFGLSTKLGAGQEHVSNVCCGTPPYVSPEVVGHGKMTKAADVWCMGLILYELAHGRPPWRAAPKRPRQQAKAPAGGLSALTKSAPMPQEAASTAAAATPLAPAAPAQRQQPPARAIALPALVRGSHPGASGGDSEPAGDAAADASPSVVEPKPAATSYQLAASSPPLRPGEPAQRPFSAPGGPAGPSAACISVDGAEALARMATQAVVAGGKEDGPGQGTQAVGAAASPAAAADPERCSPRQPPHPASPASGGGLGEGTGRNASPRAEAALGGGSEGGGGHGSAASAQPDDVQATVFSTANAMAASAAGMSRPIPPPLLPPPPATPPPPDRNPLGDPLCVVDPSRLAWSPSLPPEYVSLGRSCLARQPEARPAFPAIVRQLLALQKAVDAAVAEAAKMSARRAVAAAARETREA